MDQVSSNPEKIVKDYLKELKETLNVEKVIIFGSAARGEMKEDSDIDFIVISPDFSKVPFMKRLVLLSRARGEKFLSPAMDILGYTDEEFEKLSKKSVVLQEAKEEGKILTKM